MIESIEAALFPIVCKINEYLSNYILVFLLLGIGFWYSIKTRFVQIRCFKEGWNSVFGNLSLRGKKHDSGMSSFQALALPLRSARATSSALPAPSSPAAPAPSSGCG
jgi:AGCS family alanine or glycine:cation symporter